MTALRTSEDQDVVETIEEAARTACNILDSKFPGCEKNGITSNFQGLLVEVLTHMLKGRSVLDERRGHYTRLPTLIIDDSFFGTPCIRGEAFLVTKDGLEQWGAIGSGSDGGCKFLGRELLALNPDSNRFRPMPQIGDAWTSFEAAAKAALQFLRDEGLSLEEATALGLNIQAVVPDQSRETGYILAAPALQLAA